jgi:diadenosine tetraphosphatase ApaH/serine/threonine PP2A family protein phosphatase
LLYVIISDLHANLEAVETCFREIDSMKADRIICLGDLVDYCAQPNEVIDIVRSRCDVVIMGNHDEAQVDDFVCDGFSESARISSVHTRTVIKPEHKQYITSLPYSHTENGLRFVHASPLNPQEYDYVLDKYSALANFRSYDESICFIGHSHQPVVFAESRLGIKLTKPDDVKKGRRYIVNVGSVGQPRDGDPRLAFGLFDSDNFVYSLIRLEYDVDTASKKIEKEGLPQRLADRLFRGI